MCKVYAYVERLNQNTFGGHDLDDPGISGLLTVSADCSAGCCWTGAFLFSSRSVTLLSNCSGSAL